MIVLSGKVYSVRPHQISTYPYNDIIDDKKKSGESEKIDFDKNLKKIEELILYLLSRRPKYELTYVDHSTDKEAYTACIALDRLFDALVKDLIKEKFSDIVLISQVVKDIRIVLGNLHLESDSEEYANPSPFYEEKIHRLMSELKRLIVIPKQCQEFEDIFGPNRKRKDSFG
jgi:hypothetical protein